MSKNLITIGMALLLSSGALLTDRAQGSQMKILGGHVPAAVASLTAKGLLPDTNQLSLAIGLPLRNTDALSNLLQQVYDPSSTNYHKYLSPQEFTDRFGPTIQDYQSVIDFANKNGLVVTKGFSNRMLLDVQGKVSDIQKAFSVHLRVYHHPTENRDFYAPDVDPSIPATLPIADISGLDNYNRPHPNYHLKPSSAATIHTAKSQPNAVPQATTGSGPFGNYIGNDFRNAYIPGSTLDGSGQQVALVEFDGYLASDIAEYETLAGRTNIPLQNVLLDGFSGFPTGTGGEVEVSLDIEVLVSMAPALTKIVVYEGSPFNFVPNDVLNQIATDNSARQISSSWSWTGGPQTTTDQIFRQMALQGQSYYNAVGDEDAFTPGANSINGVDNPDLTHYPGDSPYVTEVGGTTLTMNGAGANYASETVWNWDIRFGTDFDGVGTCGGISSFYSIPSWQTNVNMTAARGSTTHRNTPDVALTADDVFVIADNGSEYPGTGGTSCAAPLWAGFTALINQQSTNNGFASVGFINPALYAIAAGANYTNCFHDITTGNNTWSGSPNLFFAVPGYDLCTGLGTPNGTNLINALVGSAPLTSVIGHLSAPAPPYGTTLANLNGGNPNGLWELFIQDDTLINSGVISNGWWLTLTTATPVGYAADNAITMTASPGNAALNGLVNYSVTVTNYGPSGSTNVVVSDTLPAGATYVSSSTSQGSATYDGLNVVWSVGNLATNAGATLSLTLEPTVNGNFYNYAAVSATTPDPNPDDNSTSTTINVGAVSPPELSASVHSSGMFQFTISNGQSGQQYIVQASTNLVNWVDIYTNPAYTVPFTFSDTNLTGYSSRFYRVIPAP
jgi:uncharacterized repeat protein (TIGR01451 family)